MFRTISVCGTHGKTTTSSLISHILNKEVGCNYLIGDGRGHADENNEYYVWQTIWVLDTFYRKNEKEI